MTTPTTAPIPATAPEGATPGVRLAVEYWTVTMDAQDSCGSCDQTLTEVSTALDAVRPLAARLGITLDLLPRTIKTWAEAVNHRVVASPTIRAAGIELRPSHPDDTDTRMWAWRGTTTTSATPEALLDFLVQALAARSQQLGGYLASGGPAPYVRQFLRTASAAEAPVSSACGCGPAARG
jgi:hypothetical protein